MCQIVPLAREAAILGVQQGLDLEGAKGERGEEGDEDTRLARAFLMGTSEIVYREGKLCSCQMFHSPRYFPQDLRPQRLEE